MKRSKAETHRLALVKKIRESNFEYFNINAIKLEFSFDRFGRQTFGESNLAPFFNQKLVKDKFKLLLKNIIKHLDLFELNINVFNNRYYGYGDNDYCFNFVLSDIKKRVIGTLLFSLSKEGVIFVNYNEKSNAFHVTNELLSKLLKLNENDVTLNVHLYYSNDPLKLKENKKTTELARVKEHFLFQKRILDFYEEQYNFDIRNDKGKIRHLNFFYLINETVNYYWVVCTSYIPYENFIDYKKKLDFNEETVFQDLLKYQIIPLSIQEECKGCSKEELFAYYHLMNY